MAPRSAPEKMSPKKSKTSKKVNKNLYWQLKTFFITLNNTSFQSVTTPFAFSGLGPLNIKTTKLTISHPV
jgi:hypothetical protein